jgi:dihydroorotase
VLGTKNETNNTSTRGVVHVGIFAVPIAKEGFDLFALTASTASKVKTQMLGAVSAPRS